MKKTKRVLALILVLLVVAFCITACGENGPEDDETEDYADVRNFKGLAVTLTSSNGWDSNGSRFEQFNVSIENHNGPAVYSWKVIIPASSGVGDDNHWNCNLDISGNSINLSNVDYNGTIATNNTVSDIGMILKSSNSSDLSKLSGTYLIDKDTGKGRLLTKEELKAFREGPDGDSEDPYTPPKPPAPPEEGTPLANHGALHVEGINLMDSKGQMYQLKGPSTHGLQWFPQYVNEGAFKSVRDDWGANVVRLAMYTDENGYCSGGNKAELENVIDTGVNAATNLGMYVIIDWHILHDNNPKMHEAEAIDFFSRMSAKYANHDNVLYEICNEPNGGTDWNTIRDYACNVIPAIRANDPDAVVIVGTPTWSQDVDQVAMNPLDFNNVMYSLHFYAGTHKDDLRRKLVTARSNGTPVFVSEFSICDASGNGGIDYASADAWKQLINENNMSYIGWSLCNKNETSALLSPSCNKIDNFTDADLSDTGAYLKAWIRGQ